ncbi:MAG: PD-(D/E)XK nuclease-like domain-containing protein [Planctomycetaceae bacterium]
MIREPASFYHAEAGRHLTSHLLADFRKSPLLYHKKRTGLVRDEDRPAYLLGRAAHVLILEGRKRFDEEFAVGGPVNPKTGSVYGANTKAFAEWAAAQGKPVLTQEQFDLLLRMHLGVARHELATNLIAEGVPEGVVRTEYCGRACQIRIDWFNPHHGICDLKTVDEIDWFEADARRYGYVHQMAFYRAVVHEVADQSVPVYFITVEKREPFRAGVWQVSNEALGIARRGNEQAIERLKECEASNTWPSGYEAIRIFDDI